MDNNIKLAENILAEAKRVKDTFVECGTFWSLEDCISSLKEHAPFNKYPLDAFNNAMLMEQKNKFTLN